MNSETLELMKTWTRTSSRIVPAFPMLTWPELNPVVGVSSSYKSSNLT